MKKLLLSLLALAIILTAASCTNPAKPSASDTPDENHTENPIQSPTGTNPAAGASELRYGVTAEPSSLDPYLNVGADSIGLFYNVFEGLVKIGADGELHPAIAASWDISTDYKTYTFTLRQGVTFHNGSPVVFGDILYSIRKAAESGLRGFSNIESTESSETTLTITLIEPDNDFLSVLTNAIIPENYGMSDTAPIGTGPYKFLSYSPQASLVFIRNEDYWGEKPDIEKISIVLLADFNAVSLSLQSGNIDGAFIDASFLGSVDTVKYNIIQRSSNAPQVLALNNKTAPFNDVRVRQALNYGINRDEIIALVGQGYGDRSCSPLIPGISKYYNENLRTAYQYDPEKAKSLLDEAGAAGLTFTIRAPSNYPVHVQTAEVIASELSNIGVTAHIELVDWGTWVEDVYIGRNYEATIISLAAESVSPKGELKRYHSETANNFMGFASAHYDEVYTAASEASGDTRVSLFKEAQQIINDEAASVFIQDISMLGVLAKGFTGLSSFPVYGVIDFAAIKAVK